MRINFLKAKGNWNDVKESAMTTIGKEAGTSPSSEWKRRMLLCEHSPIRQLIFKWKWVDLLSWVSVHFVRHKFGIEHWVRTQRTDRTGVDRNSEPQGSFIEHEVEANAQAIINISRKRLCLMASDETREAWLEVLNKIKYLEPELFRASVSDCIYRGHCFEYKSCGWFRTEEYKEQLALYRKGINGHE